MLVKSLNNYQTMSHMHRLCLREIATGCHPVPFASCMSTRCAYSKIRLFSPSPGVSQAVSSRAAAHPQPSAASYRHRFLLLCLCRNHSAFLPKAGVLEPLMSPERMILNGFSCIFKINLPENALFLKIRMWRRSCHFLT